MDQVKEVLRKAAALIREKGWVKHAFFRAGDEDCPGGYCVSGAINQVTKNDPNVCDPDELFGLQWQAKQLIRRELGQFFSNVPDWNDECSRTKEDVLATLDKLGAE